MLFGSKNKVNVKKENNYSPYKPKNPKQIPFMLQLNHDGQKTVAPHPAYLLNLHHPLVPNIPPFTTPANTFKDHRLKITAKCSLSSNTL